VSGYQEKKTEWGEKGRGKRRGGAISPAHLKGRQPLKRIVKADEEGENGRNTRGRGGRSKGKIKLKGKKKAIKKRKHTTR